MTLELSHYLKNVIDNSRLDSSEEREVKDELETHIEDSLMELKEAGLSDEEAIEQALGKLGSTELLSRQIYEAHSQGSWKQVFLAALPHLVFGTFFALNWWQYIGWVPVLIALVLLATVCAWYHGKPAWVFPWLGYALIPVVSAGILLVYLPGAWVFWSLLLYCPLALLWFGKIVIQTTRRDWLFSSLMLLPVPIITGWLLVIAPQARFTEQSLQYLRHYAPWIGLSFLAMAFTIATFIRLRQRWLRIGLLVISGLLTITLIAFYNIGRFNISTFLGLVMVMWGIFLVPPMLERWLKSSQSRREQHVLTRQHLKSRIQIPEEGDHKCLR